MASWRSVRSGPARQGDAERRSPLPPSDRPRRRRLLRCIIYVIIYRILHAPHTRVEPDWHHVSTRRPAVVPPLVRPTRDHEARRSRPPDHPPPHQLSWRVRRLTFLCPLGRACACVCGRRRRRRTTRTGRCVRRGGVQTAPRCLPFRDPPPGRRYPATQHRSIVAGRVGRSVVAVNQKGRIFSGTPPYYIIYILYYIYLYNMHL